MKILYGNENYKEMKIIRLATKKIQNATVILKNNV